MQSCIPLKLAALLQEMKNNCKFVVLTSSADRNDFKRAEDLDVDGYILKGAYPEEILLGINLISRGRRYYDPSILELMLKKQNRSPMEELTPREQEVLRELGKGMTNKQIAQKLFITEYTVKKHVSQILAKLGLADRTQAALYAISHQVV